MRYVNKSKQIWQQCELLDFDSLRNRTCPDRP